MDDRGAAASHEFDEGLAREARVARLDRVAQRLAVEVGRQQVEETREVVRVERLVFRELPVDRTEPVTEFGESALHEGRDRAPAIGEHAAIGRVARRLQREHEALRRLAAPLCVGRGLLRAVKRSIDLDRGQVAARVLELEPLHERVGIEAAAPGLVGPAADADAHDAGAEFAGLADRLGHGPSLCAAIAWRA